jgi:hypothetical protein
VQNLTPIPIFVKGGSASCGMKTFRDSCGKPKNAIRESRVRTCGSQRVSLSVRYAGQRGHAATCLARRRAATSETPHRPGTRAGPASAGRTRAKHLGSKRHAALPPLRRSQRISEGLRFFVDRPVGEQRLRARPSSSGTRAGGLTSRSTSTGGLARVTIKPPGALKAIADEPLQVARLEAARAAKRAATAVAARSERLVVRRALHASSRLESPASLSVGAPR